MAADSATDGCIGADADTILPAVGEGASGFTRAGKESTSCAIRFRIASFGRRPTPPPRLSSMCVALVVPTRATVTAGWPMTYLRKNCAHDLASNSAAHSGRGVFPTRAKRLRPIPPQLDPALLLKGKN